MSNARRTLAAALTTLLLGAAALLGLPGVIGVTALAAPPADGSPAAGSSSLPDPHFVRLQVDTITPGTITSSSPAQVNVRGMVTNDGDREVRNLQVRMQRGPALQSAAELRSALRSSPAELSTLGSFVTISAALSPGQSAPFSLYLPLSGSPSSSLALSEPGVYPLLVNVNGVPDFGDRARLDEVHFLLPVLSLPATPKAATETRQGPSVPSTPAGITVLWPLAERPRLLPSALGTPALLSDDDLARSFADGGRLDGLLKAVEQRTRPSADPAGALANSLCLGIDPDLLVTAQAMTHGYEVAGAGDAVTPGTGGPAAGAWLERLKAASKQRCVVALPWAQADLNALSRASLTELEGAAVGSGADVVAKTLGLPTLPEVSWPAGGLLTDRTATNLRTLGKNAVLVSADGVTTSSGAALAPTVQTAQLAAGTASLGAALIDAPSATALAATGPGDQRQLRLQDALGAIAWPAINAASGGTTEGTPASSALLAPPQVWDVSPDEAQTLLGEVSTLLQTGAARSQSLPAVLDAVNASTARAVLNYPVQASLTEVPPSTTATVSRAAADIREFGSALKLDPQSGVSPNDLLAPLQLGLLRSVAAPAKPPPEVQDGVPDNPQVDAVRSELSRLRDSVSLQAPGGTYTLASSKSPLLLVVRNDLPVSVNVRITVDAPAGLRAADIGVEELPAHSGRQLQVPTTVSRTGQFAVDVSLTTDTGQQLGEPTRLQVRSTAYGSATALAIAGAALILLVLVARRLWHRFRGQPDRADDPPVDL